MQVSAETLSKTMTVLKLALLIGAYGSLILIPISKGAYIFHRGECPDGHKEGDTWPTMGGYCIECACFANGWGCGSCSPYVILENCYHETNTTAPYPDCCPSLVCKDDPHFNPSKIELVGR